MRDTSLAISDSYPPRFIRAQSFWLLLAVAAVVSMSVYYFARSATPMENSALGPTNRTNASSVPLHALIEQLVKWTKHGNRIRINRADLSPLERTRDALAHMILGELMQIQSSGIGTVVNWKKSARYASNRSARSDRSYGQQFFKSQQTATFLKYAAPLISGFLPSAGESQSERRFRSDQYSEHGNQRDKNERSRNLIFTMVAGTILFASLNQIVGSAHHQKRLKLPGTFLQLVKARDIRIRRRRWQAVEKKRRELRDVLTTVQTWIEIGQPACGIETSLFAYDATTAGSPHAKFSNTRFSVSVACSGSGENEQPNIAINQPTVASTSREQRDPVIDRELKTPSNSALLREQRYEELTQHFRHHVEHVVEENFIMSDANTLIDFSNEFSEHSSHRYRYMQSSEQQTAATELASSYRLSDARGTGDKVSQLASHEYKLAFHPLVDRSSDQKIVQTSANDLELERLNSAAKFLSLVEQMGAMPYLANLDATCTPFYVSKKFESLIGFPSEQWCANPGLRIAHIHPDDRESVFAAVRNTLLERGIFSLDYRLFTREGTMCWIHDEARVITNAEGIPLFMQGVVLDISECKQAQKELERSHLELQKLIGALDALREKEQKRLAQEMHDDLGQLLAAMKIDLSTLAKRLPPDQPQIAEQVDTLNDLVDAMVSSVRRIIADLPPKIMEDRGLFRALHLLGVNFEKRHGVVTQFELPKTEPSLNENIATPIYRIIQEALNNVAKHADATKVVIRLNWTESCLVLDVKDDGKGMGQREMHKADSFGLISMRERVNALAGEMTIESNVGTGTSIRIALPIAAPDRRT